MSSAQHRFYGIQAGPRGGPRITNNPREVQQYEAAGHNVGVFGSPDNARAFAARVVAGVSARAAPKQAKKRIRYYGVLIGRNGSRVTTEYEEAREETSGFSGGKYRGFSTMADAEAYISTNATTSHVAEYGSKTTCDGHVWFDGSSLSNPGPAAGGAVLKDVNGRTVWSGGRYIGLATSNVAEYAGLQLGLETVLNNLPWRRITIHGDSQLIIKQVQGIYKTTEAHLKPLQEAALALVKEFSSVEWDLVGRELNSEADRVANLATSTQRDSSAWVVPPTEVQGVTGRRQLEDKQTLLFWKYMCEDKTRRGDHTVAAMKKAFQGHYRNEWFPRDPVGVELRHAGSWSNVFKWLYTRRKFVRWVGKFVIYKDDPKPSLDARSASQKADAELRDRLTREKDKLEEDRDGIIISKVPPLLLEPKTPHTCNIVVVNTSSFAFSVSAKPIFPRKCREIKCNALPSTTLYSRGGSKTVSVTFELPSFGVTKCVVLFKLINEGSAETFEIARYLEARVTSEDAESLQPTAPYERKIRKGRYFQHEKIEPGPQLPKLDNNDNWARPGAYGVPTRVRNAISVDACGLNSEGIKMVVGLLHTHAHVQARVGDVTSCVEVGPEDDSGYFSEKNYRTFWDNLLWTEEIQQEANMTDYDMNSSLEETRNMLALTVPGLLDGRPSVVRGDCLVATYQGKKYEGIVYEAQRDRLLLRFSPAFHASYVAGVVVPLRFVFNRMPIRLEHQGVELADANLRPSLVFPMTRNTTICASLCARGTTMRLHNRELNEEQILAVSNIVKAEGRRSPYIVFGPPGTGKTTTVVEAIYQVVMVRGARVLVTAPSNTAADVLASRLVGAGFGRTKLHRRNTHSRSAASVPEELYPYCSQKDGDIFKQLSSAELKEYKIVVCTLSTAARLYNSGSGGGFDAVFIDEAGQATEPETMAALGAAVQEDSTTPNPNIQVVLAGDPKQLGPVIASHLARAFGLGRSFLERLMDNGGIYARPYNAVYITKLVRNYRSHPAILELPSSLFYDSELVNAADRGSTHSFVGWPELPNKQVPMIFEGLVGEETQEGDSPSWFNVSEVLKVVEYVKRVLEYKKSGIKKDQIGVITPYRKQAQKIRQLLNKNRLDDVKCQSVELWQGQERRVMIISTVRSRSNYTGVDEKGIGFLKNPKRFNVALTRPKCLLIVIGNPYLLLGDDHWGKLIRHCVEKEAYTGVTLDLSLDSSSSDDYEHVDADEPDD